MNKCDAPSYQKTKAYENNRWFAAHRGLKWTKGVNLAPDEYYKGCTLLVKEIVGPGEVHYRKFADTDACFDAVMRCDSDQTAANVCRTLRTQVVISGEIFEDAIVDLPAGFETQNIESSVPAVLSLRKKIVSGAGRPTDQELTDWGYTP